MRSENSCFQAIITVLHPLTPSYGEPDVAGNNVVYRIKDELYYAVTMEEWTGEQWVKYLGEDVQVEFVMLDPYVRKTLSMANSELDVEEATHSTVGLGEG